jgi:hypothetical protein
MTIDEIIATAFNAELRLPTYYDMEYMLQAKTGHKCWARLEDLPKALRSLVNERADATGKRQSGVNIYVLPERIGGQHHEGPPGWTLLILPYWHEGGSQIIMASAGCDHSFETINLGRCYNKHACTKCDYAYFVDSGD